ncbi:MAG: Adenosylcobinamide-GDP ribazoletransferase [Chloroflexi bacterium]|nr:Adenosylcobinamide-GDP ribazoletransferase [Chloroflexota bacterium]
MADSRVGGFGVVGACSLILLKYISLITIPVGLRAVALLLMPTVGRWSVVYAITVFPSARKEGLGQVFKKQASWLRMGMATVITVAVAAAFLNYAGVAMVVVVWVTVFLLGRTLTSRLGGLTGDAYGAIIELSEVASLILIIIIG